MSAPVRVLHTLASRAPAHGGPSRSVPALARALREAGTEVDLGVWAEDRGPWQRAGSYALVHDHGVWLPSNLAAARAARRAGVPLVVSPRGMLEPWALAHRRLKKRVAWRAYQRRILDGAAVLHVTSRAEAEGVRLLGLRTPVALIPNGVELPPPAGPRRQEGPRRALFLSRVHPKKGLPLLVDAWARAAPRGWELVIAGPDEGGHTEEIRAQAARAGLADAVSFGGPVDDAEKWALYRSADLFVLPTRSENFGLVVAEALAAGVPVVTTRAAPWPALDRHGCGWWVDVDVDALARALREATALTEAERAAMGARGRAYVERAYSWRHAAEEMKGVYTWALEGGAAPPCVRQA